MTKISRKSWHYWLYRQSYCADSQTKIDVCHYIRGVLETIGLFTLVALLLSAVLFFIGWGIYYNYLTFMYFFYDYKWHDDYGATLFIDGMLLAWGFIWGMVKLISTNKVNSFSSIVIEKTKSKTCFYIDIE
jgi:hypothetical protein